MRELNRWLGVLGLLLWVPVASAQVTLDAVPGGLAEVSLTSLDGPPPEAFFGRNRILVMAFGGRWVGLVGLSLDLVPGRYVVMARVEESEEPITREFTVYPRRVDERPAARVPELPADIPRIDFEWRGDLDARLPLQPPVALPVERIFGRFRHSDASGSEYIRFVSFDIDAGTPVRAPDHGRIASVAKHASGRFVWIDHGMGLYTCIGPLAQTDVRKTAAVEAGQRIGKATPGAEGATRPLYWSVFLNGAAVNPVLMSQTRKPAGAGHEEAAQ